MIIVEMNQKSNFTKESTSPKILDLEKLVFDLYQLACLGGVWVCVIILGLE